MRKVLIFPALAALAAPALAMGQIDGPITITGHVASNTTISPSPLTDVTVGTPVRMVFTTNRTGWFTPFWGPTGRFVHVNEQSFELHVGTGSTEIVMYSGSTTNQSLLFTNTGFVTTAVSQDVFEFFQMDLDFPMHSVYFKAQTDSAPSVPGWTSPLIDELPSCTQSGAFDIALSQSSGGSCPWPTPGVSRGCWWVWQQTNGPVSPSPVMTIDFDGTIAVDHGCQADFNRSGTATIQDIFDFLAAWFAHSPAADFGCDGMVTVQDLFDFLAAWFAGC